MILDIIYIKCKGCLGKFYHKIEIYFLDGLNFLIDEKIKNLTVPQASTISSGNTFLSSIVVTTHRPKETIWT